MSIGFFHTRVNEFFLKPSRILNEPANARERSSRQALTTNERKIAEYNVGGCMCVDADTVIIKQWGRVAKDSGTWRVAGCAQSDESMGVLSEAC